MNRLAVLILAALIALDLTGPTASARSISGTAGNDVIRGTPGHDEIKTNGGNDVVYGGAGNDDIEAGGGRDIVRGQSGDDAISGGNGGDILHGGAGRDDLDGENGRDILHSTDGRGGNDSANGGPGSDICHGDRGDGHRSCSFSEDGSGTGGPGGEDTASGRCRVSGPITFAEPLGYTPESTTFTDFAAGTCTGTVNGVFMANERMYLRAAGSGLLSCSSTQVTSTGTMVYTRNTATRSDDVEIDYTAESQGISGQVVSRARGRVSGEVLAKVSFHGDSETLRQCAAGEFRRGIYDMEGQSITPLVG